MKKCPRDVLFCILEQCDPPTYCNLLNTGWSALPRVNTQRVRKQAEWKQIRKERMRRRIVEAAKPEKVEEAVLGSQELTDLFGLDDADVADPFLALVKTIAHDLSTKLNDEMAEHMIENRVFNVIPQGFLTPEISAQADMLMQRMQPEKLEAILKFASLFGGAAGGQ